MTHDGQVVMADFSGDGKYVVTASLDGKARVWNAETGESIGLPLMHGGPLTSAQFSANGKLIVTASEDRTARVWDAASGKPVSEPMLQGGVVLRALQPWRRTHCLRRG
jgi:WD40 repeat protein